MSDLVTRILDCVPAGTYALRALFGLVDIVESDAVATAAVEGGYAPRMLVNPDFVERYAATPERLVMLVMHELHHIILGHTRLLPTSTRLDNIVFDAVINAMLCRAFPDPAGIAFFTDFYAADRVPEAILRPPSRWHPEDKHIPISRELVDAGYQELALAHRGLYTPAGATYEEVREALEKSCTEATPPGSGSSAATTRAGSRRGTWRIERRCCSTWSARSWSSGRSHPSRSVAVRWPMRCSPPSSGRAAWSGTEPGCGRCCAGPAVSPSVARSVRPATWSGPPPRPFRAVSGAMS